MLVTALLVAAQLVTTDTQAGTIACVGDSITAGARLDHPGDHAWPAQLEARLHSNPKSQRIIVQSYARGGATLLRSGDLPIWNTDAFERLTRRSDHDDVIVLLGTNDTVEGERGNWTHAASWEDDLAALVQSLRATREDARVLLAGPPPIFPDAKGLSPGRIDALTERAPRIADLRERSRAFAADHDGVEHLDLDDVLRIEHVVDGVHPNPFGQEAIATAVHRWVAEVHDLPFDDRAAVQPAPSAEYRAGAGWDGGTWWRALEHLREVGRRNPEARVVFLGDSITQGLSGHANRAAQPNGTRAIDTTFAEDGAVVLGLSGDRTEHLRYRIAHGALPSMKPQVVVLQIGINNLNSAGHSPEDVAAGIRAVVRDLRIAQPQALVLVCGPFPAGTSMASDLRRSVDAVHGLIESIGEDPACADARGKPRVKYVDLRSLFVDEEGALRTTMAGDALHISAEGRKRWIAAIEPEVRGELARRSR